VALPRETAQSNRSVSAMPAEAHPTRIPRQNPAATADTLLDVGQQKQVRPQ